ncbi:HD domain-containing protein [Kaistia dalseonensis]|uniref:HD domain-containing protein n=1 Tax=Kaistia dalseonensis TaxID=410840 RepID=A0ABU0H8P3_9HYPH|nr:HD domain-containing protein [Kaistia dalseonensis]MCX5496074.1 HD domain-containing protein [Kaistia dalseonensis]MDQ0438678.1 hypothetical protein [Kaistia dalseonensis]
MSLLLPRDTPLWNLARPYLDVRSNDAHTLYSYRLGIALLRVHPEADGAIVLPAIVLHDTGWKLMPAEKLAAAVGPSPLYPELQREHEIAGVAIARDILATVGDPTIPVEPVLAIIDGHDTRAEPHSIEDALMKDADKLWRFTAHGVATIGGWFDTPAQETVAMLESFVLPKFCTSAGRTMAEALLAQAHAAAHLDQALGEVSAT